MFWEISSIDLKAVQNKTLFCSCLCERVIPVFY